MSNMGYKIPQEILDTPEGPQIKLAFDQLMGAGGGELFKRFAGNCVSVADVIQSVLSYFGVKAKCFECQVLAVKDIGPQKAFSFVGLNDIGVTPNNVDTHVVVVTETTIPILIDGSLGHLLPEDDQIVVRQLKSLDPEIIGLFTFPTIQLLYKQKKNIRLPSLHQKNLLDRLNDETQTKQRLTTLQKFTIVIAGFSLVNFILNMSLLALRVMHP